jgi:DNA (cytosine-5)-methyltransferase 1
LGLKDNAEVSTSAVAHVSAVQPMVERWNTNGLVSRLDKCREFSAKTDATLQFLVAGLGRYPPIELLADAAPVESVSGAPGTREEPLPTGAWAANTFLALNAPSRIALGCEIFVAQENGWREMVEQARASEVDGLASD